MECGSADGAWQSIYAALDCGDCNDGDANFGAAKEAEVGEDGSRHIGWVDGLGAASAVGNDADDDDR